MELLSPALDLPLEQSNLIAEISFIVSLLSLWGASLILNAWSLIGKGRGFSAAVVLLALGDFIWSLSFVLSSGGLFFFRNHFSYPVCVALRLMYQMGAISSLCWSLCILVLIVESFEDGEARRQKLWFSSFSILAYGYPLVVIAVFLSLQVIQQEADGYCYPKPPYRLYFFFVPVIALLSLSMLLFGVIIYLHCSRPTVSHHRKYAVRSALFPLVMLATWSLNIVAHLIPSAPFGLVVSYVVLLNAQGVWDSLIYGLTNGRFRDFFAKRKLRTVILFLFGPLLIVPLLLRRAFLYRQKKLEDRNPEYQQVSSSFAAAPTSIFPLSAQAHSIPNDGIAASLSLGEPNGASTQGGSFLSVPKLADMTTFVSDDENDE